MDVSFTVNGHTTQVVLKDLREKTNKQGRPYGVIPISYATVNVPTKDGEGSLIVRLSGCLIVRSAAQVKDAPTTPNGSTPAGQDALKEAQAKVAALEAQLNAQAAKPKGKPLPAGAVSALLA